MNFENGEGGECISDVWTNIMQRTMLYGQVPYKGQGSCVQVGPFKNGTATQVEHGEGWKMANEFGCGKRWFPVSDLSRSEYDNSTDVRSNSEV